MDAQKLSGILLIAAFATITLSWIVNAPGLYATQDIEERLQIIESHRMRWLVSQASIFLYGLLTMVAFVLLASSLRTTGQGWIPVLGAVAIVAGTLSGLYFVYLQTTDPRGGYSGAYPAPETLAYWLWLAGQVLFGVAVLQAGLPAWLGYLTAGSALAYGIFFLLTGAGFMAPGVLALVSLVIGIVLLRR